MKKTYIFDLDGTLINSIYDLADSMNVVLEKCGYSTYETEKYKYFVGNGTLKLVERTVPESERNEKRIKELHEMFSSEYNKRCVNKTRPYDGIVDLLKKLKSDGNVLAVASNKPDAFVKYIVNSIFDKEIFDVIEGKKDGVPTKPAPDIVYNVMKKVGSDKSFTVMIGDSNVDVETAHNAGIKCIGCVWGFRGRKELEDAGAEYIAEKPEDIARVNFAD